MEAQKLYHVEIAPLVILPLARSPFFSYLSSESINRGSLVAIPFGKRAIEGVVFDCAPLPGLARLDESARQAPVWMKWVSKVIEKQFLTAEQLELAQYVSEEYFTPLGKTLKHFLPKRTKARKRKKDITSKLETLRLNKDESHIIKAFTTLKENAIGYVDTSQLEDRRRLFVQLAKKITAQRKQALFLIPEITLLPECEATFLKYFPSKKIAVLHSKLADGPYFEMWEKIRRGEAAVILATRQGLFAPFRRLGLVVLLEEQDESYKQWDMSPRYDSKRVAESLAALHHAKLLFVSETPSIESLYRIKQKKYVSLTPLIKTPPLAKALEIVNLRLERFRKNYSPLSQTLIDALRDTLSRGERALLYIHRQGMSAFSVCENCKNIFRCPESLHVLINNKDGTFRCGACGYKTGSFPSCPSCGHLAFRSVGFGTERVEHEVRKLFPLARVFRADRTTMQRASSAEDLYARASEGEIDILIGTQMVLKADSLPKLALVGMIDADSLLSFPNFRADEKLFQVLTRFTDRLAVTREKNRAGYLIIQTFHPESTFFQRMAALDSKAFSEKLLSEREDLFYPPFSRLISITCQGKTEEETKAAAEGMEASLREIFPKKDSRYRVSISQSAEKTISKKFFESSLIIRIPAGEPFTKEIRAFLQRASASSVIDIDPLSFF
ncbi:MAG: primosomal protein N' [Candidatus Moranbacteria bacterium RIFCSPLOWO2_12_FULL_48_12]|nr:MAG: primosomal protein N' [Candidatus Moranbacteria bacterium RIFCSPLOWO2_12_FULL_48_12]